MFLILNTSFHAFNHGKILRLCCNYIVTVDLIGKLNVFCHSSCCVFVYLLQIFLFCTYRVLYILYMMSSLGSDKARGPREKALPAATHTSQPQKQIQVSQWKRIHLKTQSLDSQKCWDKANKVHTTSHQYNHNFLLFCSCATHILLSAKIGETWSVMALLSLFYRQLLSRFGLLKWSMTRMTLTLRTKLIRWRTL